MEYDLRLFREHEQGVVPPTLRIYSWRPKCITLGHSQKPEAEIDLDKAAALGWDVIKRPTGGGIVFHNEAEVTYSLVMDKDDPRLPKGLVPSYKKISEAVVFALNGLGVNASVKTTRDPRPATRDVLCFSYPAEYEVVANGKKIVGSAQKRGRKTLLQQGSLFVRRTEPAAFTVLQQPYADINAVSLEELAGREFGFDELSAALVKGFSSLF